MWTNTTVLLACWSVENCDEIFIWYFLLTGLILCTRKNIRVYIQFMLAFRSLTFNSCHIWVLFLVNWSVIKCLAHETARTLYQRQLPTSTRTTNVRARWLEWRVFIFMVTWELVIFMVTWVLEMQLDCSKITL